MSKTSFNAGRILSIFQLLLLLPIFMAAFQSVPRRCHQISSNPSHHSQHGVLINRVQYLQRHEISSGKIQLELENNEPLFPERLNLIFDSKCSVCQLEVNYLQSRIDSHFGGNDELIRFTDLESPNGYDESDPANGGVTYEMGMRSFHAVKPNGEILHGVPVFREAYEIVDQAWIWEVTKIIPIVGTLASMLYDFFASIRTVLTRGSSVENLIEEHYRATQITDGDDATLCVPCQQGKDRLDN